MESLATEDLGKVKTLFPYIGKKPPRIGREVVNAFEQSGCEIFVDLFCGSLAMLCYLPWDVKVVVNDINGNLTNLYMVIRDSPSDFVSEVINLPYSEVVFQRFTEDLKSADYMLEFEDTARLPDKRHREQLIMNFNITHVNKYGEDDIKPYR